MKDTETALNYLIENFPDFIDKMHPDDMQPFMVFGDFGIYIRDGIDKNIFNDTELEKIFNFLNDMGLSSQDNVHNLLTVGVLEIITDSKKATIIAKDKLKAGALEDFKSIEKFWYSKDKE